MLKLSKREPEWYDVLPGVRILFAPITTRARRAASRVARGAQPSDADASEVQGADGEVDAAEDGRSEEIAEDVSRELMARAILDWEGVTDPDEKPLPVTPENVAMLLDDPDAFDACDVAYVGRYVMAQLEKNALAAASNGISETVTAANDIASSSATPGNAAKPAPTAKRKARPTKPKTSST